MFASKFLSPRVLLRTFVLVLSVALPYSSGLAAGQQSDADQVVAARVLGAQWKQMSRRAGMIFAGTVLAADPPATQLDALLPAAAITPATVSATRLSFRVERGIAGVETGQILTIREWAGASSMHRPMNAGQRVLLFLYPLSRLGFTSPVGGALGQVFLDTSGRYVPATKSAANFKPLSAPENAGKLTGASPLQSDLYAPTFSSGSSSSGSSNSRRLDATGKVSVDQLERAIRGARLAREE